MTYSFEQVRNVLECSDFVPDGEYMIWVQMVWTLVMRERMNGRRCFSEEMHTYALIYGICRIYQLFCARYFEEEAPDPPKLCLETINLVDDAICYGELDEDFPRRVDSEGILWNAFVAVLHHDDNMKPVFALLKRTLGRERTFAALYYCLNYEQFSLEDWETDDFYYGDIDDPDELEAARRDNDDYETRKRYTECEDATELLDLILNDVDIPRIEAYEWLAENM